VPDSQAFDSSQNIFRESETALLPSRLRRIYSFVASRSNIVESRSNIVESRSNPAGILCLMAIQGHIG
jgi:hypothetical protein